MVQDITMHLLVLLVALFGSISGYPTMEGDQPLVSIAQGDVYGLAENRENINVYAFRSIPFAEPPLDELRFKPPVPAGPFGTLNATDNPNACLQLVGTGREDCLYLNVYLPDSAFEVGTTREPLPVMVWIHGGGFTLGDIQTYDANQRLLGHDVIVVSMQYRLGIIGFFSTGDEAAPGNYGLMDQTLALQWVQDNIAEFGGDPNRVTIFGQSAGSASVHMQILTPYASGLFNQAIAISGNGLCPWANGREFEESAMKLADRFNCSTVSEELVTCLQDINGKILNSALQSFSEWLFQPFYMGPRVDGDYIPDEPAILVRDGRYNQVPLMTGTTSDEMALSTGEMFAIPKSINSLNADFDTNGPISLWLFEDEDPINTATTSYDYYLGTTVVDIENEDHMDGTTLMYTERLFHTPLDWLVKYQTQYSDVYMYYYDFRSSFGLMDEYASLFNVSEHMMGLVGHGDDLQMIFDIAPEGALNSTDDMFMIDLLPKIYTNFVKTGTPTPDDSDLGFIWPLANWDDLQVAELNPSPALIGDIRAVNRDFWESLPLRINDIIN